MILLFLFLINTLGAQDTDSAYIPQNTDEIYIDEVARIDPDTIKHSPSRAIMLALALPGLGQAYNQKYFKIPVVYTAIGVAGYAIYFNNKNYKQASLNYTTDPSNLNERYLRAWRRNYELSIIAMAAVYALQVIDAYVDANLYAWDVSRNLSLRIQPDINKLFGPHNFPVNSYGLSCSLRF